MSVTIRLLGIKEAQAAVTRYKDGAAAAGKMAVLVGNRVRYAPYVHFGTRRMRGRPYLANALRAVAPRIRTEITVALPKGPRAVLDAALRLGHAVQRAAQAEAPVRTGNLRRDIHTVAGVRR